MIRRRSVLLPALAGPVSWMTAAPAHAGGQIEEPLADSVRTALTSAIANSAPPVPEFADIDVRLKYLRWLGAMSNRLRRRKADWNERREFLQTVWYESKRAGLDPGLVLGLIQVESAFRKFAVSPVGARGYMQVMPFWTRVIGNGDPSSLFHMQTNLRFGCVILRHYIDRERGDLYMALGRYNGSRGKPQYPNAVFNAAKLYEWKETGPEPVSPVPGVPPERVPGG
ncbi:MAG: peptidoglycan lytic transglycosylase, Glycoside Hydrolase Family 23-like protein [Ramlibacter sp.]|nr:peptidoglycan lytic transglycosylase, Glycoside Hydrolase Family 23-like protein [Ramlibacter sp.]